MSRDFIIPKHIITGENALSESATNFSKMGTKALIVSDSTMVKLGNVATLTKVLDAIEIQYEIYSEIDGEPTDDMIDMGVKKYREANCDFLIGFGGGSPLDSMKAIGAVIGNGKDIDSYLNEKITKRGPNMVALPTTAGTGSEATQFTIITNTKQNIKMLLKGEPLIPQLAIIDPQFTISVPKAVTAATGLDALCHAVESYTSKKAQPLSQTFSISATKRILKYLPIAYLEGGNIEARKQMAIASLEAGIAFNNSSVTLIHGMSRPIGALYHVPHGLSNAMLLKECFTFALDGAYSAFGTLAKECGVANEDDEMKLASEKLLSEINKLIKFCHVPTLEEFGVNKQSYFANIDKMVEDALASGSPQNTLKNCGIKDLVEIYQKTWV